MSVLFLVHGGLWEAMDAERFWRTPGIVAGLEARGLTVIAPDRPLKAGSWREETAVLSEVLRAERVVLVGASNGCSVAVRLAIAYPESVERLVLSWPATGGDPVVDERIRAGLADQGASTEVVDELLRAETLRGVRDDELGLLGIPVAVVPSVPENPTHQRKTVDALLRLIPGIVELPGSPEPPSPHFPRHLPEYVETLAAFSG